MKRPAKKSIPDTNTIIRYLVKDDDGLYAKAKAFFDNVKTGSEKVIVLESVIAECIYVLTRIYKVPREKASASLTGILHYKGVANEDREELIRALVLFSERKLDIVDCILCAKADGPDVHLFSFDDQLNRISASGKR
ncbi:MAG: PIN domain-containing protein [Nitrospiraceae bacterium]|nr:PIN domain-containing protein [Nitrospiraceae bacterium]